MRSGLIAGSLIFVSLGVEAITPDLLKWCMEKNGQRFTEDFLVKLEGDRFEPFSDLVPVQGGGWQFVLRAFSRAGRRDSRL
ncbi:MAG: hypothetical protein AB1505_05435 [Candidatus Latescibacterota bacterium]